MSLKVNMAQIKTEPANIKKNREAIIKAIHQARAEGANIVVFPELAISGYGASSSLLNQGFIEQVAEALEEIKEASRDITTIVGYPEVVKQDIYSSVAIIQNGKLLGSHRKMVLPTSELFTENYYLKRGDSPTVLNIDGRRIGIAISEDILTPNALSECDFLIVSSAFNWSNTKSEEKEAIVQELVASIGTPTLFVNALTATDNLVFAGNSALFNRSGIPIIRLQCFKEKQATFELDRIDSITRTSPLAIRGQEALYETLKFALREHLKKIGKHRVTVSLTQQIDSHLLLALAVDTVGSENVTPLLINYHTYLPSEMKQIHYLCKELGVKLRKKEINQNDILSLSHSFDIDAQQRYQWEITLAEKIENALFINYSNITNACPLSDLNKTCLMLGIKRAGSLSLSYYMPFLDIYHEDMVALAEFRNILSPIFSREAIQAKKERVIRHPKVNIGELKLSVADDIIYRFTERNESPQYISKQYDDPEMVTSLISLIRRIKKERNYTISGPLIASHSISHDWHYPNTKIERKEIALGEGS